MTDRRCKKHKTYTGQNKPTGNCLACWKLYADNQANQARLLAQTLRNHQDAGRIRSDAEVRLLEALDDLITKRVAQ